MSNPATVQDVVTRRSADGALRTAARSERPRHFLSVRRAMWIALMVAGALSVVPMSRSVLVNLETWMLLQSDDAAIRNQLADAAEVSGSAEYLEALAELAIQPKTQNLEAASILGHAAVQADPHQAHTWALLAYLENKKSGKFTTAARDALVQSMDACPLCDTELVRWRFNFVLANWNAVPDETRHRAFEQADALRWIGQNSEFLAEMRMKAVGAGIPFDEYRAAVNTPVRTLDIAPAPEAAAAPLLQLRPKT